MKKILIITLIISVFFSCKKEKTDTFNTNEVPVTFQEYLDIAKKYNLQDSIKGHEKFFLGGVLDLKQFPKATKENIERIFIQQRRSIDRKHESDIYFAKRCDLKSLQEYFTLLESLPISYQDRLENSGGIDNYNTWKKSMYEEFDVYLDPECVITSLSPGDKPDGGTKGWRLLHKAKAKSK